MMEMEFFGVKVWEYAVFVGILVGGSGLCFAFDWMLRHWILTRLKLHGKGKLLQKGFRKQMIMLVFFFVALSLVASLQISVEWKTFLQKVGVIGIGYSVTVMVSRVLEIFFREYWYHRLKERDERFNEGFIKSLWGILRLVLWLIAFFIVLDNLGVKINTILAGLGIGGIAIAFAAQSFFGDLFAFFPIFLDKPYSVGDYLVVDADTQGTVEHIGLRSTRMRSLSGELIVISNKDLTSVRIHNYHHMERRRAVLRFGVVYQTPLEKIKKIPPMVKDIVQKQDKVTFDRCHFDRFGEHSLLFECVYYVESGEFNLHMDVKEVILHGIIEAFEKERIEFAYPTQIPYNYQVKN